MSYTEKTLLAGRVCSSTRSQEGFVSLPQKEFRGIKYVIAVGPQGYRALVDTGTPSPFVVTHSDGRHFGTRKNAITTAKTVIKWFIKFGGWRLPKEW